MLLRVHLVGISHFLFHGIEVSAIWLIAIPGFMMDQMHFSFHLSFSFFLFFGEKVLWCADDLRVNCKLCI